MQYNQQQKFIPSHWTIARTSICLSFSQSLLLSSKEYCINWEGWGMEMVQKFPFLSIHHENGFGVQFDIDNFFKPTKIKQNNSGFVDSIRLNIISEEQLGFRTISANDKQIFHIFFISLPNYMSN
jgi:hypothetical protein